jgi:hypothetical protein
MKKQIILGSFLAFAGIVNAQWTTSGSNIYKTVSPGNVGIGATNPLLPLDVRGSSAIGGGLVPFDFNWNTLTDERTILLSGAPGGYGTMVLGRNDVPAAGQTLGFILFNQKVSTTLGVQNPNITTNRGIKAAITAESKGLGGTYGDFGADLIFCTASDNVPATCPERMRLDLNGNLGIGTSAPSEQLHTTAGVRFAGLTTGGTPNNMVLSDATGKLWLSAIPTSGISNACTSINFVPKTSTTGGNLACSQIFDNGTSVGIGTTSGFAYTWVSGLTGTAPPPASGNVRLHINGVTKALAYFATSDMRYKKDINSIKNASDIISKLEGKTYFWKTDDYKEKDFSTTRQYGFIAQELEKVVPEAVITDENGYKSVNYDMIIPVLVQNAKEQQKQINEQNELINELLSKTNNATGVNQLNNGNEGFALDQNIPNPFSQETVIKYTLTQQTKTAVLNVYDLSGKQITSFPLTDRGASSITISSEKLAAGIYIYSVVADGKIMDSKRMVVAQK